MDKNKHKESILIIPSWYPSLMDPNGVPYIRAQAQSLHRAGYDVTVVFTQPYSFKTVLKQKKILLKTREAVTEGVREILTYRPKTHFRRWDEITRFRMGKRIIRKMIRQGFSPDIIHAHTFLAGNLALWAKYKFHVPLVVTEHYTGFARGIVKKWEEKRAFWLYRESDLNLAVSQKFADLLEEKSFSPFCVLPNMVNTDLFSLREEDTLKNKKYFTFLFVGSLHDKKNPEMLLKAFHNNYRKNNKIRLVLAGEGELSSSLKEYVKRNKLEDIVEFPGFLRSEDVAERMKTADAFVLPSRFETFGIVVIEAMASGLPVVVTRSGGPESFVLPENGIVIDQDQAQLEKALSEVLSGDWNFQAIREYVSNNFSEKAVIKKINDHYNRLLNTPKIIQASRELTTSGGISNVACELARHLTQKECRVETLTLTPPESLATEELGKIRSVKIPGWVNLFRGYLKNYWKTKLFTKEVDKIYRRERKDRRVVTISHRDSYGADIAVGHSCHRQAVEVKKQSGRSLWFINPIHRYYLKQERSIFSSPTVRLAAISRSISEEYRRFYNIPEERVEIIPNGVDTNKFDPSLRKIARPAIFKELSLDNDSFLLLLAGNEFWRKGLMPLIESLPCLKEKNIIPTVLVVGGADRKVFVQRAKDLNVNDQVRFVGRKDNIEDYFAASDLFVLPTSYEPFGLVGIEAMAAGLPLLAPCEGGIADYLVDRKNGLNILIDPSDIAEKIALLYNDRKLVATLGNGGRQTALKYQWSEIAEQYKSLIEKVFNEKN